MAITTLKAGFNGDEAKKGLDSLANSASRAGDAAQNAGERGERSIEEMRAEVQRLQSELDQAQGELQEMGGAADSAGERLGDMGDKGRRAGDDISDGAKRAEKSANNLSMAATGVQAAFELGKDAVEGISAGLDALVEAGNPAAEELKSSFSEVGDELLTIAMDDRFQQMLTDVATVVREDLLPAVSTVGDTLLTWKTTASNSVASWFTSAGEAIGLFEEGTTSLLETDQQRREEQHRANSENLEARLKEAKAARALVDIDKELTRLREDAAESEVEAAESESELNQIIRDREELLRKAGKTSERNAEKERKWLEEIGLAEKKRRELRKRDHDEAMERDRKYFEERQRLEKEAADKAISERQRVFDAQAEMQKGIWAAEEARDKAKREKLEGSKEFKGLVGALGQGADDQRRLLEEFVKEQVQAAEKDAKLGGANGQQIKAAGARARKQASDDWRKFQRGQDDFAPVAVDVEAEIRRKQQNGIPLTPEEAAADKRLDRRGDVDRGIDRARERIIDRNREQANKAVDQQRGVSPEERAVQERGLDAAERAAREVSQNGAELSSLGQRVAALEKMWQAIERSGDERRRRNGGRP